VLLVLLDAAVHLFVVSLFLGTVSPLSKLTLATPILGFANIVTALQPTTTIKYHRNVHRDVFAFNADYSSTRLHSIAILDYTKSFKVSL